MAGNKVVYPVTVSPAAPGKAPPAAVTRLDGGTSAEGPRFGVARIAERAELSKRRVQQMLSEIPADVRNPAPAWKHTSLPQEIRERLDALGRQRLFRDGAAWLAAGRDAWRPRIDGRPVAFGDLTEACQTRAAARCQALRPVLDFMFTKPQSTWRIRDLEKAAARDLSCSVAQVRRWINRVIERDGGRESFDVLELYLDEKLALGAKDPAGPGIDIEQLPASVRCVVADLGDPMELTPEDRYDLWKVLLKEGALIEGHLPESRERGHAIWELIERVLKAARLARNSETAVRLYYQKRKAWLASGSFDFLLDRRGSDSGNFRRPAFSKDLDAIAWKATQHNGDISQGQRQAYLEGLLSREYIEYARLDDKLDKGEVPESVRKDLTARVKRLQDRHRGKRQHELNRVRVQRNWDDCEPGDFFSGDDLTAPVYFKTKDSEGNDIITRGQLLICNDEKSNFLPGAALLPKRTYNSNDIRRLFRKVHKDYGLPHRGYYVENGAWAAKVIDGEDRRTMVPWRDTEREFELQPEQYRVEFRSRNLEEGSGLNDPRLGTRVHHAKDAPAKSIEGIFGKLQKLMEPEGLYVGRNEQIEKYEDAQGIIRLARNGLPSALAKIPTFQQWKSRLARIIDQYNDTPQPRSKKLKGLTPRRAFDEGQKKRPLRKLPPELEYLLWSHAKRRRIGKMGLRVTISGKPYYYASEGTGGREGEEVMVWWNIEDPSFVIATDLDGSNPFIAHSLELPSKTATREEQAHYNRTRRAHLKAIEDDYLNLKRTYSASIVNYNDYSEQDLETGRGIEEKKAEVGRRRRDEAMERQQAEQRAAALGIEIDLDAPDFDRRLRAAEKERAADERLRSRIHGGELL